MTANIASPRVALAAHFLTAAGRYWLTVFPSICRETRHWHARAEAIPDPVLRELALHAQRIKRGNIDGSAAFAAFAPPAHRRETVRAQVAFQSAYDYVDTLCEQPNDDPVANGCQLHQALLTALDHDTGHPDYYARFQRSSDGGYLAQIVDACRSALHTLPSRTLIAEPAQRIARRIIAYQSLNLSEANGGQHLLEQWALKATPQDTGLHWWETAAAAGSSLGLFALIAAAAHPALRTTEATAIEDAYWPWIGALHSLLDSLIDQPEDTAAQQRSLLDYYTDPNETARRLEMLAHEALHAARALPKAHEHTLILAGMASFYLTAPEAATPNAQLASRNVLTALGPITRPSMTLHNARRAAARTRRRIHPS
jgi:tetraprenyl-beta-curcumene synthase